MRYSIKVKRKILRRQLPDMKALAMFLCIFAAIGVTSVMAQGGGKAEPNRIQFARGSTSTTLSGTLANDQEMEYVFGASKGQTVTITNSKTSLFDFRVFSDENDFETEFDSSPKLTFEIPETGDYMFFVRKKATRPNAARFSITLSIK